MGPLRQSDHSSAGGPAVSKQENTTIELPYPLGGGSYRFECATGTDPKYPGSLFVRASCALIHSVFCVEGWEVATPWELAVYELLHATLCARYAVACSVPSEWDCQQSCL